MPPVAAPAIRPSQILAGVRHALPSFFTPEFRRAAADLEKPFFEPLWNAQDRAFQSAPGEEIELTASEIFELCLCAHWATFSSFAPADVEALIRKKLWDGSVIGALTSDELDRMAELVLDAYSWVTQTVSRRQVQSTISHDWITAHQGEWFSVAVAAYAVTKERSPLRAAAILEKLHFEVTRQAKVYLELRRSRDGVGMLKAASLIAHNLADLDRAIETWGLESVEDPLVEFAYKAGLESGSRALRFSGALSEAVRLNRAYMAPENHRHFALRAPKALRRSLDLLLPIAPFYDEWGGILAVHPALSPADLVEVIDALVSGWEKLKGPEAQTITYAYPRAIAGLIERYPGGMAALSTAIPAELDRKLRTGLFKSLTSVSRSRFEDQWSQAAFAFLK